MVFQLLHNTTRAKVQRKADQNKRSSSQGRGMLLQKLVGTT